MVGDVEVDENGPLPGQALADDENENENDDANDDDDDDDGEYVGDEAAAGDSGGGGGGEDGGDSVAGAVVPPDLEPEAEDPATGFEYEGEARETQQAVMHPCAKCARVWSKMDFLVERQPCNFWAAYMVERNDRNLLQHLWILGTPWKPLRRLNYPETLISTSPYSLERGQGMRDMPLASQNYLPVER